MRFYGMEFRAVLKLPIRVFWTLSRMIERIRADEILAWMPAHSIAMGGEHVTKIYEQVKATVGQPMISEQVEMTEADREKARRLFGAR